MNSEHFNLHSIPLAGASSAGGVIFGTITYVLGLMDTTTLDLICRIAGLSIAGICCLTGIVTATLQVARITIEVQLLREKVHLLHEEVARCPPGPDAPYSAPAPAPSAHTSPEF